jgi:hypothetical protein
MKTEESKAWRPRWQIKMKTGVCRILHVVNFAALLESQLIIFICVSTLVYSHYLIHVSEYDRRCGCLRFTSYSEISYFESRLE